MFSGIVEEVGTVEELRDSADGRWLKITASVVTTDLTMGASISINGACMTAIEFTDKWFAMEATHETLRRSTLGKLKVGSKVNLERAMKLSDRLGGHLVSGHVDAVGRVAMIETEGFSSVMTFELDANLAPFFVEKGSVAVEGVSLTVVEPTTPQKTETTFRFKVALIPHTMSVTTLGRLAVDDEVNIETDVIARYVARWALPYVDGNLNKEGANLLLGREQG
jgi:riboflavin synthase